ncbi:GPI ethanolamine phosphate transferase 1-like isoform X2 [Pomacea canaliculata]|uniref:GPI ethanolamine phosphate transferase 1-like isoform X2 n=1 Tax=Pomacea canaliculata TaxID=400727 RepID=UPI000D73D8D4|nr:GPI ethanolamine phosphate transferase 1-like isoform X2 [Pomacea canaliculata]
MVFVQINSMSWMKMETPGPFIYGWKENPVEFDSVFNESRFTWSWGSPDILPMFAKDASGNHVVTNCYPPDLEDFAGFNIMQLDTWVFQQVQDFFESSKNNETLRRILHEDKLVFFLHLLGTDTIGHSSKPYSMEYLQNIKLVDAGIQKVVGLIENFYANDRKTTYVMTSDHGMTNWGSHGAGHPHETLTPIVVWGSGIRGPELADSCGNYSDGFCDDWHLQHLARTDIEQADVAPLMAFLLGLHFPVNSVGILPLGYLNASDFEKAEGLYANALEILGQYQVKRAQVKERTISATFRPFQELTPSKQVELTQNIRNLIKNGYYQDAIAESRYVIQTALKGLRYYQTYDRLFLGFSIVVSFIGWMGYILHLLVTEHTAVGLKKRQEKPVYGTSSCSAIHFIFAALGIAVLLLLYIQSVSWTNYCYCLLPVVLWMKFTEGSEVIFIALRQTVQESSFFQICCTVLLTLVGLEIVVMSFFYRELLSLGLLAMACWIFTTPLVRTAKLTSFGWIGSCVLVSIFPLLPVVGGNVNYNLVLSSALVAFVAGVILIWRIHNHRQNETRDRISIMVMCVQLMLVAVATIIVKVTSDSIADKSGLPFIMQTMSWTVLVVSPCLPLLTNTGLQHRLISISLAFVAPYLLMSITYEGLFLLSLTSLLYSWLQVEFKMYRNQQQVFEKMTFHQKKLLNERGISDSVSTYLETADIRRAFFFIFLIMTAFFGTGNIASINSFDPVSVYCFLTVFNPFVMGGLMLVKVLIPFVLVSCGLRAVQVVTHVPLRALMLLVLLMSDFMGLHFFFFVRDYGSWLEIGTSISHYIIVMTTTIFSMLFMGLSQFLTSTTLVPLHGKTHQK